MQRVEGGDLTCQKYGGFIDAAIAEEPTAVATMRRMLAEAPKRYARRGLPRGCLVAAGDAGAEDGKVRTWLTGFRNEKTRELAATIEADIATGALPPEVDAQSLAAYVMAVLSGLVQRARDGAPRRELEGIARVAAAALPAPSTE